MKRNMLILTILIILLLTGCKNNKVKNNSYENTNVEQNTTTSSFKDNNNEFTEFKIGISDYEKYKDLSYSEMLTAEQENVAYIVGKNENGTWKIILHENVNDIIGKYENKLYFTNDDGIYYIDLTQSPFIKNEWIKYREFDVEHEAMPTDGGSFISKEKEHIFSPYMVDGEIYFNFSSSEYGLQKININSKSLDDSVKVVDECFGNYVIDTNNKILYYLKRSIPYDNLYRYDLQTNSEELMFEKVEGFRFKDNKILYYGKNAPDLSDIYEEYEPDYYIYLYDIGTKTNQLISYNKNVNNMTNDIYNNADYIDGDVYYKIGALIEKYNGGNNDIIYSHSAATAMNEFYGFSFINDDIIEVELQGQKDKYILIHKNVEKNVFEEIPDEAKETIYAEDGNSIKLLLK